MESLKHGLHGTLRLGVVPQCSISVSEMLKAVSERYPHLDYRLAVLSADQLLEALTAHTVDIGIGFFELSTLKELHFQSQPLVETGVELVFHPQHFPKLVGDTPLPLEAVAALPLCTAEPTRYFRRYLDQHFRDAGLTLHTRLETASIFQLLEGIFVGFGLRAVSARPAAIAADASVAAPSGGHRRHAASCGGGGRYGRARHAVGAKILRRRQRVAASAECLKRGVSRPVIRPRSGLQSAAMKDSASPSVWRRRFSRA